MTSTSEALSAALEREHREIDQGIEGFAIYLEEEFVFPALSEGGLVAPIFVMLREHGQIWQLLDDVEHDVTIRAGTTGVLQKCHQLLVQLQHHNMKEERILYPAADRVLPPEAAVRLTEFLASGVLPEGWVCVKARP